MIDTKVSLILLSVYLLSLKLISEDALLKLTVASVSWSISVAPELLCT